MRNAIKLIRFVKTEWIFLSIAVSSMSIFGVSILILTRLYTI